MFSHSGESSSVTTSPGPSTAGSMVPLPALSLSCDPSAFWLSSVLLRSLTLVLSASISDRSEFTFFHALFHEFGGIVAHHHGTVDAQVGGQQESGEQQHEERRDAGRLRPFRAVLSGMLRHTRLSKPA